MAKVVFLTGASGFVGSRLLRRLLQDRQVDEIRCLVHQPERFSPPINSAARLEVVAGDLLYPETYLSALQGVDSVVF